MKVERRWKMAAKKGSKKLKRKQTPKKEFWDLLAGVGFIEKDGIKFYMFGDGECGKCKFISICGHKAAVKYRKSHGM